MYFLLKKSCQDLKAPYNAAYRHETARIKSSELNRYSDTAFKLIENNRLTECSKSVN